MGNYDPLGLRPPTVEELAAQERAEIAPARHRRPGRRALLITFVTIVLLGMGAGAFALARTNSEPTLVQPYGPDAPFGVGFVDGFGEHSPKPTPQPSKSKAKPKPRVSTVDARASSRADGPLWTAGGYLEAVYWTTVFGGSYEAYIWVRNESSKPAVWEVRITLPAGATVTRTMAVNKAQASGGVWVFTSPAGELPQGQVYLFGFNGSTGSGTFALKSCSVNGSPCDPFR